MATGGEVGGTLSDNMGSENSEDVNCQPCQDDGDVRDAVGMCTDCQEYLCQGCFDIHTKTLILQDHQLLNIQEIMQNPVQLTKKDKCTVRCPKHGDKNVKYYCVTHGALSCSVCLNLDHRACKGVLYIPDVADNLENNEEYKQVNDHLSSVLTRFDKAAENAKQNSETLDKSYADALKVISDFRREIYDAIDGIERDILAQALEMRSTEMTKMTRANEERQRAEQKLRATMNKLEHFRKFQQNCNLFTEMMKFNTKMDDFDGQLKIIEKGQSCDKIEMKFTPNVEVLDSLKQIATFGKLTITGKQELLNAATSVSLTSTINKADHSHDINVKCANDKRDCWITGSAILPDSRLLIADRNNEKLKAVDVTHGKVTSHLKTYSKPWDIAVINDNQVVVTLPDVKKVVFVTTARKLAVDRSLQLGGLCYGIDYKDGKLAVSFKSPDQIKIINLQGTVLHTIQPVEKGVEIFKYPFYVSFGPDTTTVYVSNNGRHEILCASLDGTVLSSFTDKELKNPLQIVLDRCGHVYVCARITNTILQLTQDCKKTRVLLTKKDGLSHPYSVSYSESENKLYVGMDRCNDVKVYKGTH